MTAATAGAAATTAAPVARIHGGWIRHGSAGAAAAPSPTITALAVVPTRGSRTAHSAGTTGAAVTPGPANARDIHRIARAAGPPLSTVTAGTAGAARRGAAEPISAEPGAPAGTTGTTGPALTRRLCSITRRTGAALTTSPANAPVTAHAASALVTATTVAGLASVPAGTAGTTITALATLLPGTDRLDVVGTFTAGATDSAGAAVTGGAIGTGART
ncbi:hypothetical protein B1T48_28490 [Mycobacterium persicum]|nr:hypothetical protein B1T48_28490 [Mycobacterium persicum]